MLKVLKIRRRTVEIKQYYGERFLADLDRWEKVEGSPEAGEQLDAVTKRYMDIQADMDKAYVYLITLRHE